MWNGYLAALRVRAKEYDKIFLRLLFGACPLGKINQEGKQKNIQGNPALSTMRLWDEVPPLPPGETDGGRLGELGVWRIGSGRSPSGVPILSCLTYQAGIRSLAAFDSRIQT